MAAGGNLLLRRDGTIWHHLLAAHHRQEFRREQRGAGWPAVGDSLSLRTDRLALRWHELGPHQGTAAAWRPADGGGGHCALHLAADERRRDRAGAPELCRSGQHRLEFAVLVPAD